MWLQCDCTCPLVLSPSGLVLRRFFPRSEWELMSFAIFPAHSFDITTDCLFPLETPSLADVLFPEHFPQESGREEGNRSGNSGGCYSQVREPRPMPMEPFLALV